MNTPVPGIAEERTSPRSAFLVGFLAGVGAAVVLVAAILFALVPSIAHSSNLEEFARFREVAARAPVDETQKQGVIVILDQVAQRAQRKEIGIWDASLLSGNLTPFVKDCQITQEEWPEFRKELRNGLNVLGMPTQGLEDR